MINIKKTAHSFAWLLILLVCTGCIRLAGGAGYAYQGRDDEYPEAHSVRFDTQDLVHGRAPGGIET